MVEYIDREEAKAKIREKFKFVPARIEINEVLNSIPAADVVSRGAYDQTDWERCVALTQLKEIGKGLGERMDDVRPVVKGRWELDSDPGEPWRYVCNICGEKTKDTVMGKPRANFCPYCGADMREES